MWCARFISVNSQSKPGCLSSGLVVGMQKFDCIKQKGFIWVLLIEDRLVELRSFKRRRSMVEQWRCQRPKVDPSSRAWPQLETNEWAFRSVCRLKENLKWMNKLFLFLSSSTVQRYGAWYTFENKENINKEAHCQPLLLLDRVANNSAIFG